MSPNLDPLTHWLLGEIRAAGEDGEFEFFFYGSQARNAKGGLVQRMEKLGEECGGVYYRYLGIFSACLLRTSGDDHVRVFTTSFLFC